MKVTSRTNDNFVIQANMNKAGDYENVVAVATEMANSSNFDIASGCDHEGWIQLCGIWDHFQADEIMDEYRLAKASVLSK